MPDQERLLRTAFVAGAVTDGLALVPMLVPAAARLLWGFDDPSGAYRFAMGYGASLMLGWTALLVWASRRPLERRFVAALTVLVIYGICAALGVIALLLSETTQLYAFLGVFLVSGLILFGPTRGAFRRPEELEAEAYEPDH